MKTRFLHTMLITCAIILSGCIKTHPDPCAVPETGIELEPKTAILFVGEQVTLTAKVLPENATDRSVEWESSDNRLAAVDKGVVTAVAPTAEGKEVVITAKTKNGKTATSLITVKEQPKIMTITTEAPGVMFFLAGTGTGTIDWDDGAAPEQITLQPYDDENPVQLHYHDYSDAASVRIVRDIKIEGAVTYLDCHLDQVSNLDVSKNAVLNELYCTNNRLARLDVGKNDKLTNLDCSTNLLTDLDVGNNGALVQLYCGYNHLPKLDVSKNTALKALQCNDNPLKSLDLTANDALEKLWCSSNELARLDVSKNVKLTSLWCENNHLTALDVSKNAKLFDLDCKYNGLTALDVAKNTELWKLKVQGNLFTAAGLNAMFDTLHNSSSTITERTVYIMNNPGTDSCDQTIAKNRGWSVDTTGE